MEFIRDNTDVKKLENVPSQDNLENDTSISLETRNKERVKR